LNKCFKENLVKLKLNIFENLGPILGTIGKPSMKRIYGGDFIIFKTTLWEILNIIKNLSLKIDLNKIKFHNWIYPWNPIHTCNNYIILFTLGLMVAQAILINIWEVDQQ
jgi:hypothetical protein